MAATSPVIIQLDASKALRTFGNFLTLLQPFLIEGLIESMDHIGLIAASKYMTTRAVVDAATGKTEGRKGGKLNIDTTRLMRSIQNKESLFGNEAIRNVVSTGKDVVATMGSKVPYAAIHEFGGMAGRNRSVAIPARPYLRPALKDSEQFIYLTLKTKLELTVRMASRGI